MIRLVILINEYIGVSCVAEPKDATPYEIDIARQLAASIKQIKPPAHSTTYDIHHVDNFKDFKNS